LDIAGDRDDAPLEGELEELGGVSWGVGRMTGGWEGGNNGDGEE
jgi:hypothetical protein